ncbi:hypothetical protein E2562_019579 [Oryza meyeriana var. granulata]|uniref:Uncharacterized protein n=1 Tax=Oryza meyeriana var. granulata TaxID=110450 RepID=A0A6G1BYE5_9ORYZ|nr:hypothetical protein E2562_019579 [Oryza meyeriana var. granulata]
MENSGDGNDVAGRREEVLHRAVIQLLELMELNTKDGELEEGNRSRRLADSKLTKLNNKIAELKTAKFKLAEQKKNKVEPEENSRGDNVT